MKARVENVVFDIGVVLLHLEYDRAVEEARAMCDPAKAAGFRSFFRLDGRSSAVDAYERGDLTAHEFFEHFREAAGFRGSFDDFARIWRSIFAENESMIAFAREVARDFPVYFMTNASDLHVPWIFGRFPSLGFHRDCACSCYLGATKPDGLFYRLALDRFGIAAESALLIDDRPENVAGAETCGMRALLYTAPAETIEAARRLLQRS